MKKIIKLVSLAAVSALLATGCTSKTEEQSGIPDFEWMKEVGAKTFPKADSIFNVADYGAVGDAVVMNTQAIQKAIDAASAAGGGKVTFNPGIYLSGSIFIPSNIEFNVPKGTMINGSQDIADYKVIDTRVAGIEMQWPAGLININDAENSAITGDGVINGRGKPFWNKYGEMARDYYKKGLRWIVDYDCQRPRGIIVANSKNITVKDVVIYQPGFWSLHVLYSDQVTVDGVIISNNIEGRGPSTDGIDIDSSTRILVENSNINCNDDNFCLKAGRDADGLRVNRPCEYVVIRNCVAGHGAGLFTCGSETSGGIRNIVAYNIKAYGTTYGLRFKSAYNRGGVVEDIYLSNVEMVGVENPLIVQLNWNPSYSYSLLPEGYVYDSIPVHWKKMLEQPDPDKAMPKFRNIYFENVTATGAKNGIRIEGSEKSLTEGFHLKNVHISAEKAGRVAHAKDWTADNTTITGSDGAPVVVENSQNVTL